MLNQTARTTLEIDQNLLYYAKLKALEDHVPLKIIFQNSLKHYLNLKSLDDKNKKAPPVKIGGHNLGGVKSTFSRKEIYDFI